MSDNPRRYQRKYSQKQKVWNYIRRNPIFRVGDVMLALDAEKPFLKQMFWYLTECGYIRLDDDRVSYEDRVYTLIKNTGIKAPSMISNKLYDYNTGKEYEIYTRTPQDTETLILLAIAPEGSKCKEILEATGIPKPTLIRYLKKLLEKKLIRKAPKSKYERCGQ